MTDTKFLEGKRILVTGGTGSLGKAVVSRLLRGTAGTPAKVIVFSRDEGKHHQMRVDFLNARSATDEIAYANFERILEFRIGDVRDYPSVAQVVRDAQIVIHAAALKQVPSCEYFPHEAARTNINGAQNVIRAIKGEGKDVEKAIAISTDKACKPINVMGMTKAIQERIFVEANIGDPRLFLNVRYGNVIASRGSVVPLFKSQIAAGGPVTITTHDMTRFLLSLEDAVDTILEALRTARAGETYIPILPSVRVMDLARVMIGDKKVDIKVTGIRPGEKVHEILISEEETHRTVRRGKYYAIIPMLPELQHGWNHQSEVTREFSSADNIVGEDQIRELLKTAGHFQDVLQPA